MGRLFRRDRGAQPVAGPVSLTSLANLEARSGTQGKGGTRARLCRATQAGGVLAPGPRLSRPLHRSELGGTRSQRRDRVTVAVAVSTRTKSWKESHAPRP